MKTKRTKKIFKKMGQTLLPRCPIQEALAAPDLILALQLIENRMILITRLIQAKGNEPIIPSTLYSLRTWNVLRRSHSRTRSSSSSRSKSKSPTSRRRSNSRFHLLISFCWASSINYFLLGLHQDLRNHTRILAGEDLVRAQDLSALSR